jgi:hypothetical protein
MLPNAPTSRNVKTQAAADIMAAMHDAHNNTAIQRLRGMGLADDPAKLSWWATASTPVKVAVVGGGILAVVGLGIGVMSMMKKGRRR